MSQGSCPNDDKFRLKETVRHSPRMAVLLPARVPLVDCHVCNHDGNSGSESGSFGSNSGGILRQDKIHQRDVLL